MREKLIEILREVQYYGVGPWKHGMKAVGLDVIADHLLANGVTVPTGEIEFDYEAEEV